MKLNLNQNVSILSIGYIVLGIFIIEKNNFVNEGHRMKVKLLFHTPLSVMVSSGRTCWQSQDKGGCYLTPTDDIVSVDISFLDRIVNKHKHGSVSEHVVYNFAIDGISRGCLQELARHRMASYSVKSSRYTLKELKNEEPFELPLTEEKLLRASKYIKINTGVEEYNYEQLEKLRQAVSSSLPNDVSKYVIPESYLTSLAWTINARSLRNFLELRTSKSAWKEIRELAFLVYEALPFQHKFLFKDSLGENNDPEGT